MSLINQVLDKQPKNDQPWDDACSGWIDAANKLDSFKGNERCTDKYLYTAEKLLLAPFLFRVEDEFSVKPMDCRLLFMYSQGVRIAIESFDYTVLGDIFPGVWQKSYETTIGACSKNPDQCCSFAVGLANNMCQWIADCFSCILKVFALQLSRSTTLCWATFFQEGIAMELLSKSVLSELDAATCLISAMTKPAHFMLIFTLVKTALDVLKKLYSGPYCSSLLRQLEPLLIGGLRTVRLRHHFAEFWHQTFAHSSHLVLSDDMRFIVLIFFFFVWNRTCLS
ncbi:unnamed protein product [Gongylonema pulchrum]|uniref:GLOBIN domain-containing protein n=1 Tax=Gongylonema pulchrum TaxID=637853 RepID=A0A183E1A5_9BILA|nr:unnamed protein product [Gongylonema pulchrum]